MAGSIKIGQVATVVLFLFAWATSWYNLITNAVEVGTRTVGHQNPHYVLPLIVLLLGLLMTNSLGFFEFYSSNRKKEAVLAAFDLDTPYILLNQGQQILKDEECPDFAKLQMRQAIWRSLPLAVVGFFLGCRPFFEIPGCQIVGSLSVMAHHFGLEETRNKFLMKIRQDIGLDVDKNETGVSFLYAGNGTREIAQKAGLTGNDTLLGHCAEVQELLWESTQCADSKWIVKGKKFPRAQSIQ